MSKEKRVISVEMSVCSGSGSGFSYVIAMDKNVISSILYIPEKHTIEDLINIVLSNESVQPNDTICYDGNGIGVAISDITIHNENFKYKESMRPIKYTESQDIIRLLDEAKEKLVDYALNSNPDYLNRGELKKIYQEVHNLEVKQSGNRIVLSQKDNSIGRTRAVCFLNGLYVLKFNKSKIEDAIPEAIELYKEAYKSPPIGEDVDSIIIQIISDFRENLGQGIKESSTVINRFLNESEEQYIIDILMDKRYREPSFLRNRYTEDSTIVEYTRVKMRM